MQTVIPAETRSVVRGHEGNHYAMTDYLGSHATAEVGRQAYLVGQESAELRAHFHEVDQFQVVFAGRGSLGRERVGCGVVHYADAFTTYGPIRTDPAVGLSYFTLRLEPVTGINYMPEEREKRRLAGGTGEHFTCAVDDRVPPGSRPLELERSRRGAVAYGARLPAGEVLEIDGLPTRGVGYAVVLSGVLRHGERRLPAGSLVAFDAPAELGDLRADPTTADTALAVLIFPPS